MIYLDTTRATLPPYSPASGADGQFTFQRVAAADGVEASNSRPLALNKVHTLVVGATPVRIELRAEAGLSVASGTTSFRLPANSSFSFTPSVRKASDGSLRFGSNFVYIINDAATAAAWEVFIYQSGQ